MEIITLLQRNIKWRFHNPFTILIAILQPMLWLILYSAVAGYSMKGIGIMNYTAYILPGLIILVSFGACSSSGIMNYLMKADGSFYRILISPANRCSIVLAQLLEVIICTFIEVIIMFIVSLFFSVNVATGIIGLLLIALIIFLTAFFISGLTYTISLFLPNEVMYETVMNAIVLPIFFLSSALFPTDGLSRGLIIAVNINPFTHVINVLRSLIINQDILIGDVYFVILLLVIMCGVSLWLAIYTLKREAFF